MKKPARIVYIILQITMGMILIGAGIWWLASEDPAVKSNCLFVCGQSVLFLAVSFAPNILKKLDLELPDFVYIIFIGFCLAHFLLGEIFGFFATIKWWDSALHTASGMLITLLSFSVITLLNNTNGKEFKLSLAFACIFAFCISVTIGVVWEIVEFAADSWFGLNMQRAYESTVSGDRGVPLIGTAALKDSMKDLILDALGSLIVCIASAVYVVKSGSTVEKLNVIKYNKKPKIVDEKHTSNMQENGEELEIIEDNMPNSSDSYVQEDTVE